MFNAFGSQHRFLWSTEGRGICTCALEKEERSRKGKSSPCFSMRTVFLYEVRSEPQLTILWYGIEPGLAWKSFALDTNNLKDCKTNGPKRFLPSVLDQEILTLKLMLCSLLPFLLLTHLVCYCLHLRSALQQRAALSFPASLFFFQGPSSQKGERISCLASWTIKGWSFVSLNGPWQPKAKKSGWIGPLCLVQLAKADFSRSSISLLGDSCLCFY